MTNSKTMAYKCVECGLITETDEGFIGAMVPTPETSPEHHSFEQAQVLPLGIKTEEKPVAPCPDCSGEKVQEQPVLEESLDEGLYYNIGDCPECGSHHWARTGGHIAALPPIEEVAPVEKKETPDDCPECAADQAETGFSTAVAPTPEVGNELLAQQFATSSLSDVDPTPKKKVECTQCGRLEEIDDNVNEIPGCITCGSADWGQVPH